MASRPHLFRPLSGVAAETSGEARRGVRRGGGRLSPAIRTCGVGLNWSVFRLTLIRRLTASVVS